MDEVESIMNDTFGLGEEDGIFRRMLGPYDTLKKSLWRVKNGEKENIHNEKHSCASHCAL